MILAIARVPALPDAFARAAAVTGLALADVSRRLAGTLPRVLVTRSRDPAGEPSLADLAAALEAEGFATLLCDPGAIPSDEDRTVARTLELHPGGFAVLDRAGARHEHAAGAIALFQRGVRVHSKSETVQTKETKFSLGRAALTGGLVPIKKVEKTATKETTEREPFVLVGVRGAPDVILYERRLDYRFLGAAIAPASHQNLARTLERLQAIAPSAPTDDRVARPGFATSQSATRADPVDLALELVRLAHLRG